MTELGYEVPTVGEKHQASDQRVSTALTEIKSVLNGRLTAGNFAKETITAKKFTKQVGWTFQEGIQGLIKEGAKSLVSSAGSNVLEILFTVTVPGATTFAVFVESTKLLTTGTRGEIHKAQVSVGPFQILPNESIFMEPVSGEITRVDAASRSIF